MIYVHVPFCRSFCTYCDFYSETACKGRDLETFERYIASLLDETSRRRMEIVASRNVNTLYVGGGTPSVLPCHFLERLVRALPLDGFEEFTVEVNPEDIVEKGRDYLDFLIGLGVNRISMGVQSLDDRTLKWMNRRHDADRARQAYSLIRESGFRNVSIDIIYGISGMSSSVLESTLTEISQSWHPEHISAYLLSVEKGSALAGMNYNELDEEECRKHYDLTCKLLSDAGYRHYEISNWAVPGFEAVHNSAYWRRAPYTGLGPGAHSLSFLEGKQVRSWNSCTTCNWTSESETLSEKEIMEERLMLGLRTSEGVDGKVIKEKDWFIADTLIAELI